MIYWQNIAIYQKYRSERSPKRRKRLYQRDKLTNFKNDVFYGFRRKSLNEKKN